MADNDETPSLEDILAETGGSEFDWGVGDLDAGESADAIDVLRFTLGNTLFAVDGSRVREIVGFESVTPIPGAPEHIKGITLLKREVLGVLDLSKWLGIQETNTERTTTPRLVVLEYGELTAAFVADTVDGIESWPESIDVRNVPDNMDPKLKAFAASSRWVPGGVLVLLDVERILNEAAVR